MSGTADFLFLSICLYIYINYQRVGRLCRNGADAQYMQILKQKPYNFTINMLKADLSAQVLTFAFMLSSLPCLLAFGMPCTLLHFEWVFLNSCIMYISSRK